MKKILFLITGCVLLSSMCFLIYSCVKKQDVVINSSGTVLTDVSSDLLQAAKDWENQQIKATASTLSINTTPTGKLLPNWKAARLEKLANGGSLVVVESPAIKLYPTSKEGVVRKFVFNTDGTNITGGKIIEMYGTADYMAAHSSNLLENYNDGRMGDFSGGIITYDVNYKYIDSKVYKNGLVTTGSARVMRNKGPLVIQNNKQAINALQTLDDGPNCWYDYFVLYNTDTGEVIYFEILDKYGPDCDFSNNNELGGPPPPPMDPGGGGSCTQSIVNGKVITCDAPPPPVGSGKLGALLSTLSTLTADQKAQIQAVLDKLMQDCLGAALDTYMENNSKTFNFTVNSSYKPPAAYNPVDGSIIIKDPSTLGAGNLEEELFHAYQNFTMSGGTTQYSNTYNSAGSITAYGSGAGNIEFEAKVVRDMSGIRVGGAGILSYGMTDYTNFIVDITNDGTSYPTSFTSTQITQYNSVMAEMVAPSSGTLYEGLHVNSGLTPTSMFSLVNSSHCN